MCIMNIVAVQIKMFKKKNFKVMQLRIRPRYLFGKKGVFFENTCVIIFVLYNL